MKNITTLLRLVDERHVLQAAVDKLTQQIKAERTRVNRASQTVPRAKYLKARDEYKDSQERNKQLCLLLLRSYRAQGKTWKSIIEATKGLAWIDGSRVKRIILDEERQSVIEEVQS